MDVRTANSSERTYGRTNPIYRKASLLKMEIYKNLAKMIVPGCLLMIANDC